jgi:translation elongation factor P/translation initiation factor 5A
MATKKYSDLKKGDKIVLFGEDFIVRDIELSKKGVKQGRRKCRVEAENEKTGENKIIIRLAKESVKVK